MRTGELGYWWRSLGGPPPRGAPLQAATEADVAIVGAGFTGLWTAYYLKRARPSLEIVVLEREIAGFGASGAQRRLGLGLLLRARARLRTPRRRGAATSTLQRAMFATVEEIAARASRARDRRRARHRAGR